MEIVDSNTYNPMQTVKRRFFAMRNGIIADTYRSAGSPFRIIFGLNLPQIVEIARETGFSAELAEALWANTSTRESMLMAPMIMPRETFAECDARRWVESVPCAEVADVLCHRLLRHMPFAVKMAKELVAENNSTLLRYTGVRLAFNFYMQYPAEARKVAQAVLSLSDEDGARRLAVQLKEELDYMQ